MSAKNPVDHFSQVLVKELAGIKQAAEERRVPAGEVIFREGDTGDGLYVVEEGRVEITAQVTPEERRVLGHVGTGELFGEMAILDDEPRFATAIAETDCRLSFVRREVVVGILENSPKLLLSLVRDLTDRVRYVDRRYLDEVLQAERLSVVGRFAQGIVHDFKNPLNIIGMACELVADDDVDPAARAEANSLIRQQADRLTRMTNELLEFTRDSAAPMPLTASDYGAFIAEILAELQPEVAGKSVTLSCTISPPQTPVLLDANRLRHVFYNLVNNATDFMPNGGTISLSFLVSERDVTTEIKDSGPGIAPEIAARLFQPFATFGKSHGTGLGLSVCKRIIDDHHGRISARSHPDGGAAFCFTLPRAV